MAYETKDRPAKDPKAEKMSEDELQSHLHAVLTACEKFTEEVLTPDRAKATEYYQGKPFGNEEPGRSQIVVTEVRDGILGVLPSLLRVIFGSQRCVEFVPTKPSTVDAAAQASDYVQYVFAEENQGFLETLAVLKDGLLRKIGIYKYGWDERATTQPFSLTGLDQGQLESLASDPDIDLTRVVPATAAIMPGPQGPQKVPLFSAEGTRKTADGCAWVKALPPEEFLFSREARSTDEALCVAHRTELTRGELLALGLDEKVIDDVGEAESRALTDNLENIARRIDKGNERDPEAGEANDKTLYTEAYIRLDYDGDGINELRRYCLLGPNYKLAKKPEPVSYLPFAVFCPDPEPHTIVGQSWADRLMDMQRVKSSILRSTLDSLAASIFPRTAYVEGQANVQDVLNTEVGAPIRMRAPGMVQPFTHPFVGEAALPVLSYMDDVVERRTGQNKGAMGLDADALQSSTKSAVGAAVTASQAQTEMLARIFCETALKPLFKGLLRLLVEYQPRAKMVKLRENWVEIDPRSWDADMQVTVNVALGSGLIEEKVQTLLAVCEKQEMILQTFGPQNPIVTLKQYRDTLAQIIELQGFKDSSRYFQPVDPNWQPPQPSAPPPPTPEQVLAQAQLQIEQQRTERELAIKQAELQLKQQEMVWSDDRERDMHAADIVLRAKEIEAKYGAQLNQAQLEAQIERERFLTQAGVDQHATATQAGVDQHATATQAAVDQHATAAQAAVDQHATNTQAATDQYAVDNQPAPPAGDA